MTKTAWVVSNNYYKASSGRVVTQWPYGTLLYGALTKMLGGISESTRATREPAGAMEGRGR
jgi:hypothetical protein